MTSMRGSIARAVSIESRSIEMYCESLRPEQAASAANIRSLRISQTILGTERERRPESVGDHVPRIERVSEQHLAGERIRGPDRLTELDRDRDRECRDGAHPR